MNLSLYYYKAIVKSVYDGDTCTVDIDLGLGVWLHGEKLRLYGINAPELKGKEREAGLLSRDFLRGQIDGKKIQMQSIKDSKGKYGRYLAIIWIQDENKEWLNINEVMVKKGFAEYKEY